jgi:HD-like signal output (HDOD) protein
VGEHATAAAGPKGELEELVERTVAIPSCPRILGRLEKALANPEATVVDAVRILEEDPGIAARCLRVANSAVYGLKVPCSTLRHAAAVLGLRNLKTVVLHSSVVLAYEHLRRHPRFDFDRFFRHGAVTALVARQLAKFTRAFGAIDVDALAACGLLHNLGRLALLDAHKEGYLDVIVPEGSHGPGALRAEREAYGFDHADVGGVLATQWNLAPQLAAAAREHHRPAGTGSRLPALLGLANELAHAAIDHGEAGVRASLAAPEAGALGLDPESSEALVVAVVKSAHEAASSLG